MNFIPMKDLPLEFTLDKSEQIPYKLSLFLRDDRTGMYIGTPEEIETYREFPGIKISCYRYVADEDTRENTLNNYECICLPYIIYSNKKLANIDPYWEKHRIWFIYIRNVDGILKYNIYKEKPTCMKLDTKYDLNTVSGKFIIQAPEDE